MQENFDNLRTLTLATIKQAQNLHVLINSKDEGKLILTKGRAAGFIAQGILYVSKEFSKGGSYYNSIIEAEIELVKTFYKCTQVVSENDISLLHDQLAKVDNYKTKILQTDDQETKQIIFNEAAQLVNSSVIANKEEVIQELTEALKAEKTDEGKKETANNETTGEKNELQLLIEKLANVTDAAEMQDIFDAALEALEAAPKDEGLNKTFKIIKNTHANFFAALNKKHNEKKAQDTKPAAKPVAKPAAKPTVKAPAKKAASKSTTKSKSKK